MFFRVRYGGSVGTGSEIWRNTLMVQSASSTIDDITTAAAAAITLAWQGGAGVPTSLDGLYAPATTVDTLIVDQLAPGTGKNTAQRVGTLDIPGAAADTQLPPQLAIVVSHRTTVPTRAGRGRVYLPATVLGTCVDGELTTTNTAVISNCMVHLHRTINAGGNTTVVYHRSTDSADAIVSVDVGTIFDTQFRRRDKLIEVRSSVLI